LLSNAKAELGGNRRRLLDGIAKLSETNAALDSMQTQLNGLRPLLVEKTASTSALLKQVGWASHSRTAAFVAVQ
jgi:dynein heavy chain